MSDSSTDEEKKKAEQTQEDDTSDNDTPPSSSDSESQDDPENADSSTANADDKEPQSMADAVRNALAGKEEEQSSGSGEGKDKDGSSTSSSKESDKDENEEELGEVTEKELDSYHAKTRRRVEGLLNDKKELASRIEEMQPQAERMAKLEQYVADNGLTREDVNTGFEIMSLMVNDPVKAYEALTPIYESLRAYVGEVLPQDLQEQVNKGQITEEAARELSRTRSHNAINARRDEERTNREAANRAVQDRRKLADEVGSAVTEWEKTWKTTDPDYSRKQSRVLEKVELELNRRAKKNSLPQNKQEAVDMVAECKDAVDKEFKSYANSNRRNKPMDSDTEVGTKPGSTSEPKTMLEAISQAVGQ